MPFTNFESRHFSAEEKTAVLAAIDTLENALSPKLANLSPEERQQYGSVNEQNKLIINKGLTELFENSDYKNSCISLSLGYFFN